MKGVEGEVVIQPRTALPGGVLQGLRESYLAMPFTLTVPLPGTVPNPIIYPSLGHTHDGPERVCKQYTNAQLHFAIL